MPLSHQSPTAHYGKIAGDAGVVYQHTVLQ